MWDLNKKDFKIIPYIEHNALFSRISQEQIFEYYIEEKFTLGRPISSPLRQDEIPSFVIIKANNGNILYYDFATGETGNPVRFVGNLFGVGYREALYKIACDFDVVTDVYNLTEEIAREKLPKIETKVIRRPNLKLSITSRKWEARDKYFWKSFGIRKSTLEKFNVIPIKYLFFNDRIVQCDRYAYAYKEVKDGYVTYKIYQPYSKKFKWINNTNRTVHQGYRQLPPTGDLLIITKSLKDVMSLYDVCEISSVGLQAESVKVKETVIQEYKKRFKKVYCLFDNDEAGIRLAQKFSSLYNIPLLTLPSDIGKDFSDVVREVGKKRALNIMQELL